MIVTLAGDDRVDGEPEESAHVPGQSEDLICLGPGDDYACGGGFPGRVYSCEYGDVEDRLLGGPGQDRLLARRSWGGAGDDVVSFSTFGGGPEHRLFGGPGADLVEGTDYRFFDPPCSAGQNVLRGGSGPDALFGHEGNDLLAGGRSDDELRGADGRDRRPGARRMTSCGARSTAMSCVGAAGGTPVSAVPAATNLRAASRRAEFRRVTRALPQEMALLGVASKDKPVGPQISLSEGV